SALCELPDDDRPRVLVSQSATGYYGDRGPEPLDETAAPGDDFLAQVVVAWEHEASQAGSAMRVVSTRTGVVLAPGAGALAKMLPFFRLGIGGPVAGGRQYVPWIHLDDVVGAILRCLDDRTLSGPVNVTAPQPVTNAQLSTALGRALRRPAILPVPAFALHALYGEMAQVVTTGSRVVPAALQRAGYEFERADLDPALRDLLGS
ncbi:MAG: TIGR01777 family oxidoreductase, partial [Solirubrobacteraceae bacterium]